MPEEFNSSPGNNGQSQTREDMEQKEKQEQVKTVDRLIRGVNDVFIKDYSFDDLGLHFTVKMRAPNAVEIGQIQARTSSYLGGMNNFAGEYFVIVYQTLATLRVTGIDIPDLLKNDEDIYNLDILYTIGRDFEQWLKNFRF